MMRSVRAEKEKLRRSLRMQEKQSVSSAEAAAALAGCSEYAQAQVIMLYASVPSEIDTSAIIQGVLRDKKRLCLPKCTQDGIMEAYEVKDTNELSAGFAGISEPSGDAQMLSRDAIDLVVVPGLAFDKQGYRIGTGFGFYDRFLRDFGGKTVGLCRRAQFFERLPREAHDIPVGRVVVL